MEADPVKRSDSVSGKRSRSSASDSDSEQHREKKARICESAEEHKHLSTVSEGE